MAYEAKLIKLRNVRLSFPSLFQKASFNGEEGSKYEATFLIPKSDKKTIKAVQMEIKRAIKESGLKIPRDKLCLQDGDDSEYDGYEDHMSFKATSKRRPMVLDRSKDPLTEEDDVVYAGCYVNANVSLWVQNNSFGKRINGNLHGVQFVRDGEPFGGGGPATSADDFDELDEDDDDLLGDDDDSIAF